MPPKTARDKDKDKGKGKGKGKKGKKEEVFSNVDKAFCHLTITDLNKKIAHLRAHLYELEEKNIALKKDNEFVGDRKDVAQFLQRSLDKKEEEFKLLEKEFEKITRIREQESLEYQMKIKDLEDLNKTMKNQLSFEIKLLQSKLNSLDEFRFTREKLLQRLEEAENTVNAKEEEKRYEVFEMEQKALVEKDNLKKGVELQLLQLAEDFAKSNEIRASGYTRRLIRENIALHKEIEQLITVHIKMQHNYDDFVFRNKVILQNYSALEETNRNLMKNSENQIGLIAELTEKCDMFIHKFNEIARKKNLFDFLINQGECTRYNHKKVKLQLHTLRLIMDELKLENTELSTTVVRYEREMGILKETINQLKENIEIFLGVRKAPVVKCMILGEDEAMGSEECEAMIRESIRENMLEKLMKIINASEEIDDGVDVETPKESQTSLYHPGDVGFIRGSEKSSLMDLFIVDEKKGRGSTRSYSSAIDLSLLMDTKMPLTCHVEGNSVEDITMGSLYIASDEKSDQPVAMEEEEPLDYPDEGSSSDDKKDEDICGKDEKPEAPKAPVEVVEVIKKEECDSVDLEVGQTKWDSGDKIDKYGEEGGVEEGFPKAEEEDENEFPPFFFY